MVAKKLPPRDGVAFAAVVALLWHSRRLKMATTVLNEVESVQETIAWVAEEVQLARHSKCSLCSISSLELDEFVPWKELLESSLVD
jgi:hypothetical protein